MASALSPNTTISCFLGTESVTTKWEMIRLPSFIGRAKYAEHSYCWSQVLLAELGMLNTFIAAHEYDGRTASGD